MFLGVISGDVIDNQRELYTSHDEHNDKQTGNDVHNTTQNMSPGHKKNLALR
jgi:hypothetical protein